MKGLLTAMLVVIMISVAGCDLDNNTSGKYRESYFGDLNRPEEAGFDFSEGIATNDTVRDIGVEPWVNNNGEPNPDFQLSTWGDSTRKIVDLGKTSLDEAVNINTTSLVVDTVHQASMWDAYAEKGHSYYLITREGFDAFFHVDSMRIVRDSGYWVSGYWIHYFVKR